MNTEACNAEQLGIMVEHFSKVFIIFSDGMTGIWFSLRKEIQTVTVMFLSL